MYLFEKKNRKSNHQNGYPSNDVIAEVKPTSRYINELKKLYLSNKNDVIKRLNKIINELQHFQITKQYHNHRLSNSDFSELHVTGDILLVYKYERNALVVDLILDDLVNHKELKKNY